MARPLSWAQTTRLRCWIVQVSIRTSLTAQPERPSLDPDRVTAAAFGANKAVRLVRPISMRTVPLGTPDQGSERDASLQTSALHRREGLPSLESDEDRSRLYWIAELEPHVGPTTGV